MRTFNPIQRVHVCSYCEHGVTHIIDPRVYPNDIIAEKVSNAKWICGNCIENNIKKRIAESKKKRGIMIIKQ